MSRFIWPTPPLEYFIREVGEGERETVSYRAERYQFLWAEFGPPADMLLVGGIPAMFALDELKRSYAYGNYMATVVLAQAFVEQSLGGMYTLAGRDETVAKGFAALIDQAHKDNQITQQLADNLHALRKMRNPYTHHTIGTGKRTYMGRLMDSAPIAPEDLVLEDARSAVRAVADYLRAGNPDWNPTKVQWHEGDA
ncbi:MAG: hypothetical protein J0M00_14450 [Burkholderiales bacterium]|nr:hypothetical protein [Burkholderiales bacterium]